MPAPRVALVIPAWNEAESIGPVLSEVPAEAVCQVYVVCGHSADATAEIARMYNAESIQDNEIGYGAACWAGANAAAEAGAEVIAFLDGDYSDPPDSLPRVLAPILEGTADLVLGWRDIRSEIETHPLHARIGNRLVVGAMRLLAGRRLHDLPSFKAIRTNCLTRLEMREMTYGWTTEMIVKSIRIGLRIAEVPIAYRPRLAGRSKVSGTLRGTVGAAWKLSSCAVRYAGWSPRPAYAFPDQ